MQNSSAAHRTMSCATRGVAQPRSAEAETARWARQPVEKGWADADLVSPHPFRNDGEQRAPKNGKAGGEQHQIIEEETRFARYERVELVVTAQVIAVLPVRRETHHKGNDQKPDKPSADRGLRESVHRTHHA